MRRIRSAPAASSKGHSAPQAVAPSALPPAPPHRRTAKELLEAFRVFHRLNPHNGLLFWQQRTPEGQAAMHALETAENLITGAAPELPPDDDGEGSGGP